jgi:hypothetical protein
VKTFVSRISHLLAVTALLFAMIAVSPSAHANVTSISDTGTFTSPESAFQQTFTLSSTSTIEVQTWGFGGGTNAAGQLISAGGFDSLVALFSGTATNATILTDGSGNPFADAQNLFNLYAGALSGCPPAGTVTVGTVTGVCGDNTLQATLTAGTYTLLLTDANFIPLAVNPGSLSAFDLTDTTSGAYGNPPNGAYNDLSSGVFQTCASTTDCNTDNGNFAVDIVDQSGATLSPTPEPGTFALYASGLILMGFLIRKRQMFQPH